jgi:transcriptional regulator with XRE-family HTH domain
MYIENMIKEFSVRIKELREERELSQAKLAKVIKTYQQTVARWELGIVEPDMNTIIQLALFFDVSADYLLGLSDKKIN